MRFVEVSEFKLFGSKQQWVKVSACEEVSLTLVTIIQFSAIDFESQLAEVSHIQPEELVLG